MIPKIIHYCWFGGKPLPKSAKKYIASWKKFFPDYEIKRWDESNFDVNIVPYTAEAYKDKKFAFVSDYARFWVIYNFGGLYFDTDVEVIRPMPDIIDRGPFMGCERKVRTMTTNFGVAPGLGIAADAGNATYKQILDAYSSLKYGETIDDRPINIVDIITQIFIGLGWKDENVIQKCGDIIIYPTDYFCPQRPRNSKYYSLTENTRTIHHYDGTWLPKSIRIKNKIGDAIGPRVLSFLVSIKRIFVR